jgi:hypothetical protein
MVDMTRRNNVVQEKLMEAMKKYRKQRNEEFRNNQTVTIEKFDLLKNIELGKLRRLSSYLQFLVRIGGEDKQKRIRKLFIVELAIPFGIILHQINKYALMLMKTITTNKYAPLVLKLRNEFDARSSAAIEFRLEFRAIIVSSLGAIAEDSISTCKSLIRKYPTSVMNL